MAQKKSQYNKNCAINYNLLVNENDLWYTGLQKKMQTGINRRCFPEAVVQEAYF